MPPPGSAGVSVEVGEERPAGTSGTVILRTPALRGRTLRDRGSSRASGARHEGMLVRARDAGLGAPSPVSRHVRHLYRDQLPYPSPSTSHPSRCHIRQRTSVPTICEHVCHMSVTTTTLGPRCSLMLGKVRGRDIRRRDFFCRTRGKDASY
jgi:hypothetical protein